MGHSIVNATIFAYTGTFTALLFALKPFALQVNTVCGDNALAVASNPDLKPKTSQAAQSIT